MQTECIRCHKAIDTVQGYKFSPNEYLCMECYDQFKAERVAKAKKQHKNPLLDQFGADAPARGKRETPSPLVPERPSPPQPRVPEDAAFELKGQRESAAVPPPETAVPQGPAAAAPPPEPPPSAEVCDVCKRPVSDFKVPIMGGKKACMECNNLLRGLAKSMILNIKCPHCGQDIQIAQE